MAANPKLPPEEPSALDPRRYDVIDKSKPFSWGFLGAVLALICIGAVMYYFFFRGTSARPDHNKAQRMPSLFLWRT